MSRRRILSREIENIQSFHKYSQRNNTLIDTLNDDCLEHVFKFLPIMDRMRLGKVCTRWKEVSERSWYLMKTFDLSPDAWGFPPIERIDEVIFRNIMLKWGKYISEIFYTADHPKLLSFFENKLPHYISTYCFNVTNLDLTALFLFPPDVDIIAENCRKIKRLRLKVYLISSYYNEFTKLFERNKDLEDIGIQRMNHLCQSLTKLPEHKMKTIMLECYSRFENELLSEILERQKNLKRLLINSMLVGDSIIEIIGRHCKNLEFLRVCFFSGTQRDMRISPNLVNLKGLTMKHNSQVKAHFIKSVVEVCKELLFLDLEDSRILDSDLKIISNIKNLEKLNVSKTEITDNGLQYIYGLKKLICRDCKDISDSGIKKLIESSPNLELLDIRKCKKINKTYIHDIATSISNNRSNNIPLIVIA